MKKIFFIASFVLLLLTCYANSAFASDLKPSVQLDVNYKNGSFSVYTTTYPREYTGNANVLVAVYKNDVFQKILLSQKIEPRKFFHSNDGIYKILLNNENRDDYIFKCFVLEENLKPILPVQSSEFYIRPDLGMETKTRVVLITDEPYYAFDFNEEIVYAFEGYDASNDINIEGFISPSSEDAFENVKEGDVIKLSTDDDGYYTFNKNDILFGADIKREDVELNGRVVNNGVYEEVIIGKGTENSPQHRIIWGSVKERDENFLNISKTIITEQTTEEEALENIYSINRRNLKLTRIYEYDVSDDLVMNLVGRNENEYTINQLYTFIQGTKSSEVFVYLVSNEVRLMIIKSE